jgi:Methyltransferase domain
VSAAESACRVCGLSSTLAFAQPVIGRDILYFDCAHCGYLQTETPYWLEEAYADAINGFDTGIMWRNQLNTDRVMLTLASLSCSKGRVLDYAGGYGILVRLLRDAGVEAHWTDKYCQNLLARGFEVDGQPYDLVTAFEVFEHLEHPLEELRGMLDKAATVLISTELINTAATPAPDWWYYGSEHGQHIGFFRTRTLSYLANRLGCHYRTDACSLHLFSRNAIPRSWLVLQRMPWLSRLFLKRRLRSKLMSDFETLRGNRNVSR